MLLVIRICVYIFALLCIGAATIFVFDSSISIVLGVVAVFLLLCIGLRNVWNAIQYGIFTEDEE
jgi:hypothetical protein